MSKENNQFNHKKIKDLCQVIDCEHKTAPYIEQSNYLVARTSNIRNGKLIFEDIKFTTKEAFLEWTKRAIPNHGDVLFTREAPAGESCLVPEKINICLGQRMVLLRPDNKKINPHFLSLYLISEKCKNEILRRSIGSTVSRINIEDIYKISIATPPIAEQKKIAEILGTCDRQIELTANLINAKRKLKQGLMQKLLTGKLRFPEFEGQKWQKVLFSDVVSLVKEKFDPNHSQEYRDCIELEHIESETGRLLGVTNTSKLSSQKNCFQTKDVLFGKLRPYLKKYIFADFNGVCSTEIWVLRSNSKICLPEYLFQIIQSKNFLDFANKSSGTKMPRSDWNTVSECPVLLPSIEEQEKICLTLQYIDKCINQLSISLSFYQSQKKGLMQQLLTGKTRVKVD